MRARGVLDALAILSSEPFPALELGNDPDDSGRCPAVARMRCVKLWFPQWLDATSLWTNNLG